MAAAAAVRCCCSVFAVRVAVPTCCCVYVVDAAAAAVRVLGAGSGVEREWWGDDIRAGALESVQLCQPARRLLCPLQVEAGGVEHL